MSTRAKFTVTGINETSWSKEITMAPVMADDGENKDFWKATPSGEIKISIDNKVAAEMFEIDKEYYVDFTKAPEKEEVPSS